MVIRLASQRSTRHRYIATYQHKHPFLMSVEMALVTLSIARVHTIPEDLQTNLAASQQVLCRSDVRNKQHRSDEIKRSRINKIA